MLRLFFVLAVVLSCFVASLHAEEAELTITKAKLRELLEAARKEHKLPAIAAAVVDSEGHVVATAVGVRKQGDETPVTVDDKFHIGSNTKAMTAAMLARLVEQGKFGWDTPLEELFPDDKDAMGEGLRKATLVHLLSQHSGLTDYDVPIYWQTAEQGTLPEQRLALMRRAFKDQKDAKPGEKFHYTNINYVIAAAAAERATGKPWEDLMRELIFEPLDMQTAGFGPMATEGQVDQPWSHRADGTPVEPGLRGDNARLIGPAGTVHCSVGDWAKFAADQLKGARDEKGLLTAESYKKLQTPPFEGSGYALGWGRAEVPIGVILGHDGSNLWNYSTAFVVPDKNLAVLVATNLGWEGDDKNGKAGAVMAREAIIAELVK